MFASKDVFLKSTGGGAYTIARSARFRSSASANLSRTFSTGGTSRQIQTFSFWAKLGNLSATYLYVIAGYDGSSGFDAGLNFASNAFNVQVGGVTSSITTTQLFRDPSAWYHIVVAIDTTQATASNRVKIYVNGVQVTAFSTANYPAQNANTALLYANSNNRIGTNWNNNASTFYDGYITEFNAIDGQALTPSSFGAISTNGVWQPTAYTGTYGTNGFYLKFNSYATAAALGTDSSGNGNTWTVNNLSVTAGVTYDSMTDVPTLTSATEANYPTWNPLWQGRTNVPTNGNLDYPASSVGIGTMALSGSSYWEITSTGGTSTVALYSTAVSTSQTVTTGLTYGFRFNATTGAFDYTTNGSSFTSIATGLTSGPYFFYVSTAASTTASLNAGQRPFTYTPPSGFVALNTYNLTTPTIPNGAVYMAATTYTGTGATLTIANTINTTSFQPDFVWVKGRSGATDHALYDVVRGATKDMVSNTTAAETTQTTGLTAFGSTGFTIGTLAKMNTNAATYVAWQWKAGGTAVTNNVGSVTSTVSANTTAGFSAATYTAPSGTFTFGHGLNVTPGFVIIKRKESTGNWQVWTNALTAKQSVYLNATNGADTVGVDWLVVSSTTVQIVTGQFTPVGDFLAYCFAAIAGYSAIGSYTGNGSADGPFVFLGFRPRYVLIKRTDSTGDWFVFDTSRDTYNVATKDLSPNSSTSEGTGDQLDILSNGFKLRTTTVSRNASGGTYIYACFAENPFKYSLAR